MITSILIVALALLALVLAAAKKESRDAQEYNDKLWKIIIEQEQVIRKLKEQIWGDMGANPEQLGLVKNRFKKIKGENDGKENQN